MSGTAQAWAVALLAWAVTGCGAQARLAIGPTVDTEGRWGAEARLSGSLGVGSADVNVSVEPYVTAGNIGLPGEDISLGGGGALRLTGVTDDSLTFTGAFFGGGRGHVGAAGDRTGSGGVGFDVGIGYALYHRRLTQWRPDGQGGGSEQPSGRTTWNLGVAFSLEVAGDRQGARGLLSFPLCLQWFTSNWTM